MTRIRTYSELIQLKTFEARYNYLRLTGVVGESTFGWDRWLNQFFYTSRLWRRARREVILRDEGCDLGVLGYEIHAELLVHHMNPLTREDIEEKRPWIIDPEYLITTSRRTHNAIHYGDANQLQRLVVERKPGDTKLW